jgi:tetratricopeptide (TPR) repeat protein
MGDKASLIATVPGRGYQFGAQVLTTQILAEQPRNGLPDARPGDIFVQRVRERTRVVYEDGPAFQLSSHQSASLNAGTTSSRKRTWQWIAVSAFGGALIALAASYGARLFVHPSQLNGVVLADFTNETGDASLDHTLNQALEIDLEQSPFLNLLSRPKVREMLILMERTGDEALTLDLAREVCERNNAQAVLHGAIANLGRKYLLTLTADSCVNGKRIAGYKAEANSREEILSALDTVAGHVRKQLGESAASLDKFQTPIAQATTSSLEALRAYSQALESCDQGDVEEGQALLERAIQLDPNFASAYRELSNSYYNRRDYVQAAAQIRKAYELRAHTTERERLAIEIAYNINGTWDWEAAIASLKLYDQVYPNNAANWYSLCHMYSALGEYSQAIEAGEHAYRMAPHSGAGADILARAYRKANRFADAKRVAQTAITEGKELWGLHSNLFQIAFAEHDSAAMKAEAEWGFDHQETAQTLVDLGFVASSEGKRREALNDFSRARQEAIKNGDSDFADLESMWLAGILMELGDPHGAEACLNQMKSDGGDPGTMALFKADLGDPVPAQKMIEKISGSGTKNSLNLYFDLPQLRALLDLKAHQPAKAVEDLEPARKYQMRDIGVLYERARAETEAGMFDAAAADYRLILDNPGLDPIWTDNALSHVRLARVLALKNDTAASKREYETFFALWKDADTDVPILKQARIEYARLK